MHLVTAAVCAALLLVVVLIGAASATFPVRALACTGDCHGDGEVAVDELLIMVNIALGNLPIAACAAGDANQDGGLTVDEILIAVANALNGCPSLPTPTPSSRVIDIGLAFGGGPGGTTFIPLTLNTDNIVAVTVDLCFVDSVFTFSAEQTFVTQGVSLKSAAVLDAPCVFSDTRFPTGRTLHAEFTGDGSQLLPSGQFVTLAFNSSDSASTGCYPAQLQATLQTSGGDTIVNSESGTMAVFAFQGDLCEMDCACSTGFCRSGVCCENECPNGTCNAPGSEGMCVSG